MSDHSKLLVELDESLAWVKKISVPFCGRSNDIGAVLPGWYGTVFLPTAAMQSENSLQQERPWLRIEWRPPYSPELNPVELLWAHLDSTALLNTSADDLKQLATKARYGAAKIQARPKLSQGFPKHTDPI
ncbi:MAG: transposase [Deltaproteobacteria bacterium]|nr:transposase [Deltaproteobacteria bacterium]